MLTDLLTINPSHFTGLPEEYRENFLRVYHEFHYRLRTR